MSTYSAPDCTNAPAITATLTRHLPSTRVPYFNDQPARLAIRGRWDGATLDAVAVAPRVGRVPVEVSPEQPSAELPPGTFAVYLRLVDGSPSTHLAATVGTDSEAIAALAMSLSLPDEERQRHKETQAPGKPHRRSRAGDVVDGAASPLRKPAPRAYGHPGRRRPPS